MTKGSNLSAIYYFSYIVKKTILFEIMPSSTVCINDHGFVNECLCGTL